MDGATTTSGAGVPLAHERDGHGGGRRQKNWKLVGFPRHEPLDQLREASMNAADGAKRRVVLAGLAVSVAALLVPVTGVMAQNVDPQSLVGQWNGNWTEKSESKVNGPYYITIERVEGSKVFGRGEVHSRSGKTEFQFVGTLQGNRLTYGRDNVTDLTIDGNRMEGTAIGRTNWRVKLNKQN
jgi:hypothetical protein